MRNELDNVSNFFRDAHSEVKHIETLICISFAFESKVRTSLRSNALADQLSRFKVIECFFSSMDVTRSEDLLRSDL